jgi:two-component system response regulator MtrA
MSMHNGGPTRGRVLVVDDDAALSEMLGIVLRGEGFEPVFCGDGLAALDIFRASKPDVVLLDLMLPGRDGIDICRAIRAESGTPIVMLTAKSDTVDVVVGLESGADDYIVKPFKPKELVARIRARMRRTDDVSTSSLAIGDLDIDVIGHTVRRGEQVLSLTPLEFDLLVCLARKPGQVFTRETLLQDVWGYRHSADTRLVNVHVQRLRAKIEHDPENPDIVLTVRGIGYKAGPEGYTLSAQLGWVELADDVEVGAATTIDRGTYGPTVIGAGTKIDNLVMIAHNCRLGRHAMICSQVGVAGSTTTGDWVVMAGQVGVRDHVHIGDKAVLGARSGVSNDVEPGKVVLGEPAIDLRERKLQLAAMSKLPEMRRELKQLAARLAALEGGGGREAAEAA